MDLRLSSEQKILKDSVDDYARDYLVLRRAQSRSAPEGFSRDSWRMMVELGWLAVGLPEEAGGLGGSPIETMLVHEGVGAGLVLEPLLTVALAARLIGLAGSPSQRERLLPSILAGDSLAAVAHYESSARGHADFVESEALVHNGGWRLRGCKAVAIGAPWADHLIVSARIEESAELALFAIEASKLRDRLTACRTIDGLQAADVELDDLDVTPAERMTGAMNAEAALMEALDHAIAASCAEALGAMEAAIAVTAEHLRTRQQFGAPLGSFQALQHKLADMVIAVEQARSILLFGVSALTGESARSRARAISAAKVRIIDSAHLIGGHAIQLHGGIGVTEEHIVSHYFRKLVMFVNRFGGTDYHLARFASA